MVGVVGAEGGVGEVGVVGVVGIVGVVGVVGVGVEGLAVLAMRRILQPCIASSRQAIACLNVAIVSVVSRACRCRTRSDFSKASS